MVMPIIWQNLCDGFSAIDKNLSEVCDVFEFSRKKRIKLLVLPTLQKYFTPAFLTSIGLAWKSGIAAEIISYTKNSIGKNILDSKNVFDGDVMLAWTLTVVLLSLVLEYSVKALIRRYGK
jgi:NitT/TauT family transport system permease protein